MRYEDVLLNFAVLSRKAKLFGTDSLDSATLSSVFKASGGTQLPVALSRVYHPHAFSAKSISADLDRLYRMGLLKRKRTKRMFKNKKGESFGRGYQYQYELSAQGSKYASYLADFHGISRNKRKRQRNIRYKKYASDESAIQALINGKAPLPSAAVIADSQEGRIPKEGIYERFPIQHDTGLYTRFLAEKLQRGKLEIQLKTMKSRVDQLKGKGTGTDPVQQETTLQLLKKARRSVATGKIDPKIYGSVTLLQLLDLAIGKLEAHGLY